MREIPTTDIQVGVLFFSVGCLVQFVFVFSWLILITIQEFDGQGIQSFLLNLFPSGRLESINVLSTIQVQPTKFFGIPRS